MKKQVVILLTLLTLCISGCSWSRVEYPKPTEINYKYTRCSVPESPTYLKINPLVHIGSKNNLDILIRNMLIRKKHLKSLLECLECYEAQIK